VIEEPYGGNEDHNHEWGEWKFITYTGDWFNPRLYRRECPCGAKQDDEH
jgi:hypothetical protein